MTDKKEGVLRPVESASIGTVSKGWESVNKTVKKK